MNYLEDFISPAKAARVLDITPAYVRALCNDGRLGCVRTVLGRMIDRRSVDRLASERAEKQRVPA